MTYMLNGRQFIVVAVSGGSYSGEYRVRTAAAVTARYFSSTITARGEPLTASSLSIVPRGTNRASFRLNVFVSSFPIRGSIADGARIEEHLH